MSTEFRRDSGREMAGLVIIVLGFGLLLNTMGIFPFGSIIARFWFPTLLMGIGLFQLSRSQGRDGRLVAMFFMGFGAFLMLNALDLFGPFGFRARQLIFPAILIFIGMRLLMKASGPPRLDRRRERSGGPGGPGSPRSHMSREGFDATTDSSDFVQATAILGGFQRKCASPQFRGGDVTAVMGGGKLDLRDAKIHGHEAVLEIFTMMGGMEIMVPRDWVIEQRFTPVLGGYEDQTHQDIQADPKRLAIQGVTILGGVVVKN